MNTENGQKLKKENFGQKITKLCKNYWDELSSGKYNARKQIGCGTKHNLKDLERLRENMYFEWNDIIAIVKKKYEEIKSKL